MFGVSVPALCQPAISRIDAFIPNAAAPGGAAVTAGSALPAGFTLQISGAGFNSVALQGVDWINNTVPAGSFTFNPGSVSVTGSTRMSLTVPPSLFAAAASISLRVRQTNGTSSANFTVNDILRIPPNLPDGMVASPYNVPFFSGGTAPYTVSLTAGAFPPGLANPGAETVTNSGLFSGIPENAGRYSFVLQISDLWGNTAIGNYDLTVRRAPPALTTAFGAVAIPLNQTTSISFTVTNQNSNTPLTGITFGDMLPEGLVVATPNELNGSCGLGSIAAPANGSFISLSGGTLPAGGSCTFRVSVTGATAGLKSNMTSTVSSVEAGMGSPAAAGITVGDVYRVHYASNLNLGDTYIDVTNSGNYSAVEDGSVPQDICVNVYAFAPSEQLISCCACPVTPNALVSLSVRNDVISNTLTPVIPSSIVIGLVASSAAGSSCNAANVAAPTGTTTGNLATGLHAWASTLHLVPVGTGLWVNETITSPAQLGEKELNHLTWLCGFIQGNGSGYGICKSCRTGGLGGIKR